MHVFGSSASLSTTLLCLLVVMNSSASLAISSIYVIVYPESQHSSLLAIELSDHYDSDEQQVGAMNEFIASVYIKGTSSNQWHRMHDNRYNYTLPVQANTTVIDSPMSMKLTFLEEPTVNYTWHSFLKDLDGTTVYHLYITESSIQSTVAPDSISAPTISPTVSPSNDDATNSSTTTTTTATTGTISSSAGGDSKPDPTVVDIDGFAATAEEEPQKEDETVFQILIDKEWFIYILTACIGVVVVCACCISICCCCYFYRKTKKLSSSSTKDKQLDAVTADTDAENVALRPNISRRSRPPPPPKKFVREPSAHAVSSRALKQGKNAQNALLASPANGSMSVSSLVGNCSEGLECERRRSCVSAVESTTDDEERRTELHLSVHGMVHGGEKYQYIDDLELPRSENEELSRSQRSQRSGVNESSKQNRRSKSHASLSMKSLSRKFRKSKAGVLKHRSVSQEEGKSPDSRSVSCCNSSQPGLMLASQGNHSYSYSYSHAQQHNVAVAGGSGCDSHHDGKQSMPPLPQCHAVISRYDEQEHGTNQTAAVDVNGSSSSNANHTYSLSMDQLAQLQKGFAVETANGVRIQLDDHEKATANQSNRSNDSKHHPSNTYKHKHRSHKYDKLPTHRASHPTQTHRVLANGRKRVLSLIRTYEHKGQPGVPQHGPYMQVRSQSEHNEQNVLNGANHDGIDDDDDDDEISSSSHESMYHEQETDGHPTPTDAVNIAIGFDDKKDVSQNMVAVAEEQKRDDK